METESEMTPNKSSEELMVDRPLVLGQLEPLQHSEDSLFKRNFTETPKNLGFRRGTFRQQQEQCWKSSCQKQQRL